MSPEQEQPALPRDAGAGGAADAAAAGGAADAGAARGAVGAVGAAGGAAGGSGGGGAAGGGGGGGNGATLDPRRVLVGAPGATLSLMVFLVVGVLFGLALIQSWPPAAGAAPGSVTTGCAGPSPSPSPSEATTPSPSPHLTQSAASGAQTQATPSASPSATPTSSTQPFAPACLFHLIDLPTSPDGRLLTLVAIAGAIGGTIYAIRSFAMFAGNRTLVWSWMPLYFGMPIVGALLGQVFYLILRAGFLSPTTPTSDISPYGFAAVAALGGLFAAQALEKLRAVFEQIFAKVPDNKDPLNPDGGDSGQGAPVSIGTLTTAAGRVGQTITIPGKGLSQVTSVTFGGNVSAQPGAASSDTDLTVTVPAGAATGRISVSYPGGSATSPGDFTVLQ